ncbi:MAG: FtsB family cell division protein [Microthrixaceae bacterium]
MATRAPARDTKRTPSARVARSSGAGAGEPVAGRSRRTVFWQRLAVVAALCVVAGTVLAVPARGYLAQRGELASRQSEMTDLERQNDELVARRDRLDDPAEIQRIARRDYGLVAEGEESYTILPPATAGLVLPHAWPFDRLSGALERAATAPS